MVVELQKFFVLLDGSLKSEMRMMTELPRSASHDVRLLTLTLLVNDRSMRWFTGERPNPMAPSASISSN